MSFTPIIRLWPGANAALTASDWGVGVDISEYVRAPGQDGGQPITYSSGRLDEANQVDAGTMNLTLDNRTGIWTPGNANGPYYGLLKRNTPIQLSTSTGSDDFNRTSSSGAMGTSSSGQAWSGSSSWTLDGSKVYSSLAANSVAQSRLADSDAWNFDIRYTGSVSAVATGAALVAGTMARYSDSGTMLLLRLDFGTAGQVGLFLGRLVGGGLSEIASDTNIFSYTANEWVRCRFQGDESTIRAKAWKPADVNNPDDDEPDEWNVVGTDTLITGVELGLYAWRVSGNSNASPRIQYDNFSSEAQEWTGAVARWPTEWDITGNNAWAAIEAAGVLRQLRQGQGQLQSALRRQLASESPTGFWPLEDAPGSTQFSNAITGGSPATFADVSPGADETLGGAARVAVFSSATASITSPAVAGVSGSTGFSVMWLMKMAALPGASTLVARIRSSGGPVSRWEVLMSNTNITVNGYAGDDTSPHTSATALYGSEINPLEWFACQLETEVVGANTEWALLTHAVDSTTYYAQNNTYASTTAPQAASLRLGGTLLDGAAFSMMWIGENTLPFVTDEFSLVAGGYVGELAMDRAARVASEAGRPLTVEPGDSEPMGAQREATFLEVLRSCEAADYGLLYEGGSSLVIRPRTARYNPTNYLTLTMAAGEIGAPPRPVYDDQQLRNVWTITRTGGSSVTVQDDASVAAEGEIAGSDTINVQTDAVITNHAAWRVYLGTQDSLRWPNITMNFARAPGLLPYWRARRHGFRFAVSTGLDQVAGQEADVLVEGYSAELSKDVWKVTLNCSGASPWDVSVLEDSTTPVRADTAGSELNSSVTSSATSWSVATTEGPIWSTTTTFPILMKCEGEIVSVSAISGGSSPQTFTVTRSVNGVIKAHSAGAAVSLAYPSRVAL